MAVFGIPVLHEDDAVRAVRAADEMQRALAELNEDLEREFSVSLTTRIGVNTGPVVAGDPSAGHSHPTSSRMPSLEPERRATTWRAGTQSAASCSCGCSGTPRSTSTRTRRRSRVLVELFEGQGDDRGSALAWEERAYAHWFRLRMKASGTAAEQALTYAKAAGIRCSRGRGPAVRAVSRPGRSGTSGAA